MNPSFYRIVKVITTPINKDRTCYRLTDRCIGCIAFDIRYFAIILWVIHGTNRVVYWSILYCGLLQYRMNLAPRIHTRSSLIGWEETTNYSYTGVVSSGVRSNKKELDWSRWSLSDKLTPGMGKLFRQVLLDGIPWGVCWLVGVLSDITLKSA